jgi:hypothetical protein
MKSTDFQVNEALGDIAKSAISGLGRLTNPAYRRQLAKQSNSNPTRQKDYFINSFVQQFTRDQQAHPNLTLADFMEMYWRKNKWDITKLAPTYKVSLDSTIQSTESNLNTESLKKLGEVVYNIALMLPNGNTPSTYQQNTQTAAVQPNQIDPSTSQITSKITSMNNTPQEIDDLLSIAAVTLMKLKVIAPKKYNDAIVGLFNNGGNPSIAAATSAMKQSIPRKPAAEKNMMAAGGRLDPNDPNDANLLKAIQNAQAQGK